MDSRFSGTQSHRQIQDFMLRMTKISGSSIVYIMLLQYFFKNFYSLDKFGNDNQVKLMLTASDIVNQPSTKLGLVTILQE